MERPAKRLKSSTGDPALLRNAGSLRKEDTLIPELGVQGDGTDAGRPLLPTRTLELSDMQRHVPFAPGQRRPKLYRRNAEAQMVRRVPDTTVTTSVVDVAVSVAGTTITTEVAQSTGDITVAISSLGTLTVPGATTTTATGTDTNAGTVDSTSTGSQSVLASTPTTPSPTSSYFPTTSSATLPAQSASSSASGADTGIGTGTGTGTTITSGSNTLTGSSDNTHTHTATSTFQASFVNGTFITPVETATSSEISLSHSLTTSSPGSEPTLEPPFSFNITAIASLTGSESSLTATSTDVTGVYSTTIAPGGVGASGTATGRGPSSTTSDAGTGSSNGSGLTPVQQQVVGGVVGGVAGVAFVLFVALLFLKWYRKRLKAQGRLPEQQATRELPSSAGESVNPMSQRSSTVPLAAAASAFAKKFRPYSTHTVATTATASTAPDSERGFQRIAGRKIAPVLGTSGDGFGGTYGAFEKDTSATPGPSATSAERSLAESSFYRDSAGFYGGKGSSPDTSTAPYHSRGPSDTRDFAEEASQPLPLSLPTVSASRPEGFAVMRPSPARTPVTRSPMASSLKLPIQQGPTLEPDAPPTPALPQGLTPPMAIDEVGRSLASQDGSGVSRGSGRSGRSASRFIEGI